MDDNALLTNEQALAAAHAMQALDTACGLLSARFILDGEGTDMLHVQEYTAGEVAVWVGPPSGERGQRYVRYIDRESFLNAHGLRVAKED